MAEPRHHRRLNFPRAGRCRLGDLPRLTRGCASATAPRRRPCRRHSIACVSAPQATTTRRPVTTDAVIRARAAEPGSSRGELAVHPDYRGVVTISGNSGHDAKSYQERQVRGAIREVESETH